jgi:hypothetical protein
VSQLQINQIHRYFSTSLNTRFGYNSDESKTDSIWPPDLPKFTTLLSILTGSSIPICCQHKAAAANPIPNEQSIKWRSQHSASDYQQPDVSNPVFYR